MNNKLLSAILFLTLSGLALNGWADEHEAEEHEFEESVGKVELCHKGKKTIRVGAPGLSAHLAHGDTEGDCEESTEPGGPGDIDRSAAVVMMHCEAVEGTVQVTAFSSSVGFEGSAILLENGDDCADALAALINEGYRLKSVTGATDYLLIGEAPAS